MPGVSRAWLHTRVLLELIRYDFLLACRGLRGVYAGRGPRVSTAGEAGSHVESAICEAFAAVVPFYWKPVRCLQRSIVTARLMRFRGIPAEVVIGYRPNPFFSHAWVEVAGRVVND